MLQIRNISAWVGKTIQDIAIACPGRWVCCTCVFAFVFSSFVSASVLQKMCDTIVCNCLQCANGFCTLYIVTFLWVSSALFVCFVTFCVVTLWSWAEWESQKFAAASPLVAQDNWKNSCRRKQTEGLIGYNKPKLFDYGYQIWTMLPRSPRVCK